MFRQKYDKKNSDASFWDILLVSVMSGKIITREVRNFGRKNCQNADSFVSLLGLIFFLLSG